MKSYFYGFCNKVIIISIIIITNVFSSKGLQS